MDYPLSNIAQFFMITAPEFSLDKPKKRLYPDYT